MSLVTLRESVRSTIADGISDLVKVQTHAGRVDLAEIQRWGFLAPCAMVGILGVPKLEQQGGQLTGDLKWGVFVVTKDSVEVKRDVAGLLMVAALLNIITPEQRWDDDDAQMPENIQAENLYNSKLDSAGVALWGISWTAGYDFNQLDVTTLDDFLSFSASASVSENEDTPTTDTLVTLEGPE